MFEDAIGRGDQSLNDNRLYGNPEQTHRNDHEQKPPHGLHRVRAIRRRHIDEIVTVVNLMKAPQEWKQMQCAMRDVAGGEIQQDDAADDLHPQWESELTREIG